MPVYYICSYPLTPGSIIQKGNWGRIISLRKIDPGSGYIISELIYEQIRAENYNDKPSRLDVAFVCSNLDSAKEFKKDRSSFTPVEEIIYEVEPIYPNANSFETDWSLVQRFNLTIGQIEEAAHKYWRAEITGDNKKEILFDSDIKIIRRIED